MSATHVALSRDSFFIGGEWVRPQGSETSVVLSPFTEDEIARVPVAAAADIDAAVGAARNAFDSGGWASLTPAERGGYLRRISEIYRRRSEEMARLITVEVGCPITLSRGVQAASPSYILDYYADLAETYPFEERRSGPVADALLLREPVGVVGAIVPWNYPQVAAILKIAPALLAGCTIVFKPAPETPLNALLFTEIVEEAGLPAGVFNLILAGNEGGAHLVANPGLDKVSFTGSAAAGRSVASICGQAMRRSTMELGGKSASVILEDADLDVAVPWLAQSVFSNSGQTCGAQTRIVVDRKIHDDVADRLAAAARALTLGDPLDEATQLGPLAARRHRDRVENYFSVGREEGAQVVTGADRPDDQPRGWFVNPTVFANVDNRSRLAQEEIFGPVAAVIPFDSEQEALAIANDSDYGLSGSVWSADVSHGIALARRVRTGTCMVNGNRGGLNSPAGGYKQSGIGREFGPEGVGSYVELKSLGVPRDWE